MVFWNLNEFSFLFCGAAWWFWGFGLEFAFRVSFLGCEFVGLVWIDLFGEVLFLFDWIELGAKFLFFDLHAARFWMDQGFKVQWNCDIRIVGHANLGDIIFGILISLCLWLHTHCTHNWWMYGDYVLLILVIFHLFFWILRRSSCFSSVIWLILVKISSWGITIIINFWDCCYNWMQLIILLSIGGIFLDFFPILFWRFSCTESKGDKGDVTNFYTCLWLGHCMWTITYKRCFCFKFSFYRCMMCIRIT